MGVRAGARSARHRHAQGALRAVHRRPRRRGIGRRHVRHGQPGDRGDARARRPRHPGRCGQGGPRRPPRPDAARGARCRARNGPSTCSGSRASSRSAAREFAVLESMDSGKPIKESRDVDVPLAAAHFWYYAGWADKLEYAFPGRVAKPLGVAAQIIPWNFPLLMLAWKIAPALAAGNTVVLKPASTTPLSALLFADVCRQADLPPGVVNIVTGPGRDRDGARHPPGRRQGRLHRLDRDRQAHRQGRRRDRQGPDPRARRQGRQHRLRRRAARPGGRGHRQRHLLQPGRGVLRRVAAARPGIDRRAAHRQAQGPAVDDPRRRPARQEHRRRRDQLEEPSSRRSPSSSRPAWPRAPSCTSRPATCPSAATSSARRCSRTSPRATASRARRSSGRCCPC